MPVKDILIVVLSVCAIANLLMTWRKRQSE